MALLTSEADYAADDLRLVPRRGNTAHPWPEAGSLSRALNRFASMTLRAHLPEITDPGKCAPEASWLADQDADEFRF